MEGVESVSADSKSAALSIELRVQVGKYTLSRGNSVWFGAAD